ncbi:MAG: DUF1232 domain-containing protein [Synechococcales cyanobacterium RM1_1_8]|nr:DUF1232 domain-containing protein [Synechococcales cyanobacterium RM1_1_8]
MKNFPVQALYDWYRSAIRNPKYRWWIILASAAYLISPIDISLDIFPIVGWIDDGIIAGLLVAELSQLLLERLKPGDLGMEAETQAAEAPKATSTVDVQAEEV